MEKTVMMSYTEHQCLIRAKLCALKLEYRGFYDSGEPYVITEFKACDNAGQVKDEILKYWTTEREWTEIERKHLLEDIAELKAEVKRLKNKKWWRVWQR